jgi:sugar lactone lactonase YvrE
MDMSAPVSSRWSEWNLGKPTEHDGWRLERLTAPSVLYGSNGIAFGPDGRLYVAQAFANRISAVEVDSGSVDTFVPLGSDISGPDDLAFDGAGTMFITDFLGGRVWLRTADGALRASPDSFPSANGIASFGNRVFISEFRPGGRIVEIFGDGRSPRVVLEGMDFLNAMAFGPDGLLYFTAVMAGEVWRIHPDTGAAVRVLAGLFRPCAVKFDPGGILLVCCNGDGRILQADPYAPVAQLRHQSSPGLDNIAVDGNGRLFFSSFVYGGVTEILLDGTERMVVPRGLVWPHSVTATASETFASDAMSVVRIESGKAVRVGLSAQSSYPGFVRGIAARSDGSLLTTTLQGNGVLRDLPARGTVSVYDQAAMTNEVLADGLSDPTGIAPMGSGCVVTESGSGKVLAIDSEGRVETLIDGLDEPTGVAVSGDGRVFVSESGAGRVIEIRGSRTEAIVGDLTAPQGLCCDRERLFVLDAGRRELLQVTLVDGARTVLATNLPVGLPDQLADRRPEPGQFMMTHVVKRFAGIALAPSGTILIAAGGDGSVLALRPATNDALGNRQAVCDSASTTVALPDTQTAG